jgi:hypothetical protein
MTPNDWIGLTEVGSSERVPAIHRMGSDGNHCRNMYLDADGTPR